MIELQTVTTKAKNPSTNEFQDVTWGGINVLSTSGTTNYNNLTNKPTINGVTVQGSLTTGDLLITAADVGALPSGTKYGADFALSIDSQTFVVTAQLKDQDGNNLGQAKTIDLPLETMVVSGSYDDTTQKIILTLKNGQTVEFSVADLVSGLQSEITLSNKLDADLVSDVSSENKFVTTAEKATWNGKQDTISDLATIRSGAAAGATALQQSDVSSTYSATGTAPVNGTAVNVDQQRQEVEIGAVANRGAKNLLKFRGDVTSSSAGNVYAKINSDGTVSVSLTSGTTATAQLVFTLGSITNYRDRKLILSGCPTGGNYQSGYALYVANDGSTAQADTGSGATLPIVTGVTSSVVALIVRSGATISSELTFQPMVRDATIVDSTFVPYAKTNRELTVENESQQSEIDYAVNTGVKNLLKITGTTTSSNGIKYTVNQDGTVAVTGTATANSFFTVGSLSGYTGDIILTGCPANGGYQKWRLFKDGFNPSQSDTGNGMTYTLDGTSGIYVIEIYNGQGFTDANPLIFRPMLRPASITDPTFQPYALPNTTLTPAAIKAVDEGAKNIADFTSATKTTYTTATFHGVTITRNGDIFTISGTSDTNDNAFFNIYYEGSTTTKIIPPGNWVALIEDYTGSVVKDIAVQIAAPTVPSAKPYGTPIKFSLSGSESGNWLRVNIRPSTTYNGSFRLMICSQEDYAISPAFVPYALSNPVLTPALIEQVDAGVKNLLQLFQLGSSNANVGNPCTSQGVEYEIQSDGTITAYRKSSASAGAYIFLYKNGAIQNVSEFFDGKHIWSGNPPQYPDGGVSVWYKIGSGSNITMPNGALLPNANGEAVQIGFQIQTALSPTQSNPIIFKPMICTAADWNVSQKFVPYCPTNRDLYETKITMVDVFGLGKVLTSGDDMDSLSLGHFACTNATIAGTVSHAPWSDGGFFGWTMTSIQTDRFVQIAIKNSDDFQIAKRRYYGTWSNWVYSITTPAST